MRLARIVGDSHISLDRLEIFAFVSSDTQYPYVAPTKSGFERKSSLVTRHIRFVFKFFAITWFLLFSEHCMFLFDIRKEKTLG